MIYNAKDRLLTQNSGTLPDVGEGILDWYQPMVFTRVSKSVDPNFELSEAPTSFNFNGMWQNYQPTSLEIKDIGQRSWSWYQVHSDLTLLLNPDDVVTYLGVQYRVMRFEDYRLYGYYRYILIQDFSGSGPVAFLETEDGSILETEDGGDLII